MPRRGVSKPTIEQVRTIELLCSVLGFDVRIPASESEARFLIDDLRHRERLAKRATRA